MPCLRAKSLLAAVKPSLISALGRRISKGVMSVRGDKCFLCIAGHQGAFGERKGMSKYRKHKTAAFLLHLIVSPCVPTYPSHPLEHQFTLYYKGGIQWWEIQSPAAANHVPFLYLSTTDCPSFLTLLTQLCKLPKSGVVDQRRGYHTRDHFAVSESFQVISPEECDHFSNTIRTKPVFG